jgi:hypothetical protein
VEVAGDRLLLEVAGDRFVEVDCYWKWLEIANRIQSMKEKLVFMAEV